MNRRALASSLNRPALAMTNPEPMAGEPVVGCQSFSFRKFDFAGSINCLKELGLDAMEFCGVHFPADPDHPGLDDVIKQLKAAGVQTPCYGVEHFAEDKDANRKKFDFALKLGAKVITADPAPESFDQLDDLCESYDIRIAIHNHGPGARYSVVEDVLKAVEGHSMLIGACYDTGHAIRSGEKPNEGVEALGPRLISVHLKDWTHGGEEQILGRGDLDVDALAEVLKQMKFNGPMMFEYEESADNPVPDMKIGLDNWRTAWRKA